MTIGRDFLHLHEHEHISMVPRPTKKDKKQGRPLPDDFTPGNYDVVCAKGKAVHQHVGNKRFRVICRMHLDKYATAVTKQDKSRIVTTILETVQKSSEKGGFVKLDPLTGKWFEVSTHHAREKIGQTLRDSLHTKYSSSTKAKKHRRQAEKAKARSMSMESSSEELPMPSTLSAFTAAQGSTAAHGFTSRPTVHLSNVDAVLRPQPQVQQDKPKQATTTAMRRSASSCLLDIFFDDKHFQTLKAWNDGTLPSSLASSGQLSTSASTPNCYRGKAA